MFVNHLGEIIDIDRFEREEQDLAREYICPSDIVLELGARYGTVSCVINNALSNKKHHVAVEPDSRVWDALEQNRKHHKADFHILKGFISRKKLDLTNTDVHFGGYGSTSIENEHSSIPSYSVEEVHEMFDIQHFNVLVADCEGFLCEFMKENPTLFSSLELVIFEADYPDKCDYDVVRQQLKDEGFHQVVGGFQNVWSKR